MKKENKTALMKATDLLANQEQSSTLLKKKLLARKYNAQEVDEAIDKLKKFNYLNDEETCRRQFENFYSEEKLSVNKIFLKMIQRGFDGDFVKSLIPENFEERELRVAKKILAKKFSSIDDEIDSQEKIKLKKKIWQSLGYAGFSGEIIGTAVEDFFQENFQKSLECGI